jgi:uncharacterized protein YjbI with pentapeptide repeats
MASFERRFSPLSYLVLVATLSSPCAAKPTREQVIAFTQKSKNQMRRMDLIAEFGSDFSGLDLSGVDFRGCHRRRYETHLRGANFANCNLQRAEFGSAILDGADLTGANLEGATFVTAKLRRAKLLGANLKATRFYQTDLSEAQLRLADFSSAEITGSHFNGSDLSGAVLSGAKNDHWWVDLRKADLTGANLRGLRLNGARFQYAILSSADLTRAELVEADFTGADLTGARFTDADVQSAVFTGVKGLDSAQTAELAARAQRWKYELRASLAGLLKAAWFPAYIATVVALVSLSLFVFRSAVGRRWMFVAASVNALTCVPACVLLYVRSGASTTVQFNVGDPVAMDLWSTWVGLWPAFVLGLLACSTVAVCLALAFVVSNGSWTALRRAKLSLCYVVLTVVHCLFATHWIIFRNFPSA